MTSSRNDKRITLKIVNKYPLKYKKRNSHRNRNHMWTYQVKKESINQNEDGIPEKNSYQKTIIIIEGIQYTQATEALRRNSRTADRGIAYLSGAGSTVDSRAHTLPYNHTPPPTTQLSSPELHTSGLGSSHALNRESPGPK
jgi:hypothetical protein